MPSYVIRGGNLADESRLASDNYVIEASNDYATYIYDQGDDSTDTSYPLVT